MTEPLVLIENPVPETADRQPEPSPAPRLADPTSFEAVFHRFYAPLLRYARGFAGDDATAADVLQDVFLKLWQDRETLTVQVSLQALLYTMVRNRALNLKRRAARTAADVEVERLLGGTATPAPSSEAQFQAADLRRVLYRWIGELPPRRAEAFTLSRYHGLRHSEIAAVMGVSERTVDTHILLALRALRSRLDAFLQTDSSP